MPYLIAKVVRTLAAVTVIPARVLKTTAFKTKAKKFNRIIADPSFLTPVHQTYKSAGLFWQPRFKNPRREG